MCYQFHHIINAMSYYVVQVKGHLTVAAAIIRNQRQSFVSVSTCPRIEADDVEIEELHQR